MKRPAGRRSWLVRGAALFSLAVFLVLVARFWHPVYRFTSFIQLDGSNDELKIRAFRELPIYVYRNTGGYDGLFYAQIAYDPTLRDPALVAATDSLAYRGRRILPPALAWLLAAGQPSAIVHVYSLLNVGAWLALALLLWRILDVTDWRGWLGWVGVLFSAGALGSVRLALTDLVALVVIALGLMAAERSRESLATGLLAMAALARETSLLALAGVIRTPLFRRENALRLLSGILPLALWLAYIRYQVGGINPGWGNFALPLSGILGKWKDCVSAIVQGNPDHRALAWTTLFATVGLSVQLLFFAVHRRVQDRWWRIGIAYAVMTLFLGRAVWEGFPGAATRVLLPLSLAFNVLAVRIGARWPWLIAGNFAVAAGVQMFLQPPTDPHELAASRNHETALIASTTSGWYGVERTSNHHWSWSSGEGKLTVKTWPALSGPCEFRGVIRGILPSTVTVSQNGIVLWRGTASAEKAKFSFPFAVSHGEGDLVFASDRAGVREGPSPDARELAFAVYDAQLFVHKR